MANFSQQVLRSLGLLTRVFFTVREWVSFIEQKEIDDSFVVIFFSGKFPVVRVSAIYYTPRVSAGSTHRFSLLQLLL